MWPTIAIFVIFVYSLVLHIQNNKLQKKIELLQPMVEATEHLKDILYYCETVPDLKYKYLTPSINHILGPNAYESHIANPNCVFDIVHPDDYDKLIQKKLGTLNFNNPITIRLKNAEGRYLWFEEYATPIYKDGKFVAVQGIYRNIDEKIAMQELLIYKSTHDSLTKLYNREFFEEQMHIYNKQNTALTIIIADLDDLKIVNDTYGHQMGDALIKEAANCLQQCADEDVVVARIGGDEFALVMVEKTVEQVERYISQVKKQLQQNFTQYPFKSINISFGYEATEASKGMIEKIMHDADAKMYMHKNQKKKLYKV